jgi:hypothetical protein
MTLVEQWSHSLFEDLAVFRTCRAAGLELRFVPAAIMTNREATSLTNCCSFIRRQLLNVRLYHPAWWRVVAYATATGAGLTGCLGAAVLGEWWVLVPLLVYGLLTGGLLLLVPRCAPWWGMLCIPLALAVYFGCLTSAALARRVTWRGVTYEFSGPHDVRRLDYKPFDGPAPKAEKMSSL